jgi:hypothetical protein
MKEVMNMTEKKMTKREYINRILTYAHDEDKAYLEHELELLDKKNSAERKPSAKQIANAGVKSAIAEWMEHGVSYDAATITKTCPACEGMSVNKVSALLTQLGKDGVVTVSEDKRRHIYALA